MRQFIVIAASFRGSPTSDPHPSSSAATATLPGTVSSMGKATPQSATLTPAASSGTRQSGLLVWALAVAGLMCIAAFWPQVKALGTSVAGTDAGNGGWILVGVAVSAALLFYAWALARAAAITWPPPEDSPVLGCASAGSWPTEESSLAGSDPCPGVRGVGLRRAGIHQRLTMHERALRLDEGAK